MIIFIYTTLILCLGIANKLLQGISGEYGMNELLTDLPIIFLTYFGLVAVWGRAKRKRYLSESFWRVYFVIIMASAFVIPVFDQNIRSIIEEFGMSVAVAAYAATVILLIPYYWALYSYSFGKGRVWAST